MHGNDISRRRVLGGAAAVTGALAFPMIARGTYQVNPASDRRYSKRVTDLVKSSILIDMLGPLSLDLRPETVSFELTDQQAADFRTSGITSFHNAFGLGGPDAYAVTLRYFAGWNGYIARNDDVFTLVNRAADIDKAKRDGKVAVIMGVQNADHFRNVADVQTFYQLGQRCSQLTYNSQNRIGSGCTDRVDGGVSDYGVEVIKAMNSAGMLIDTSHCGDRTTLDAVELSPAAIAITHSNCRAINNHPRTKTDEAITALAKKGGVMGITGVRNFVSASEPTTMGSLVDHIDHVAKLVGIEHVGIGTDTDLYGYDQMQPDQYAMLKGSYKGSYGFRDKIDIEAFSGPLKMYNLTEELVRRGYSDANIKLVLGGNFRRLLGATWK